MTGTDVPANTLLIWACADCSATLTNGAPCDDPSYRPDRKPLNRIPADADVTEGMFTSQHAASCPLIKGVWSDDTVCECEHNTFSSVPCGACGSTLAGSRDALTIWFAE